MTIIDDACTTMSEAAREINDLRARVAELEVGLIAAIQLLMQWHDPEHDKKAYCFDLSDHPKVKPLRALLERKND